MVKTSKQVLAKMPKCYSVMSLLIDEEPHMFYASEKPGVGCFEFYGRDFSQKRIVWKEAGGCMAMIPIPSQPNSFLAIQDFYLGETNNQAKLVWFKLMHGSWVSRVMQILPYLHRFDIYQKQDKIYIALATIASKQESKEDWSTPGCIYVGELPSDWEKPLKLHVLLNNCYQNHGYWRDLDGSTGYFACEQGVVHVSPPTSPQEPWTYAWLLHHPVSELTMHGHTMMTIEPFHGNRLHIYEYQKDTYQCVYSMTENIAFAHALCAYEKDGIASFIVGMREGSQSLFIIQKMSDQYMATILDEGVGPANITVISHQNHVYLLSANRSLGEAAIYDLK